MANSDIEVPPHKEEEQLDVPDEEGNDEVRIAKNFPERRSQIFFPNFYSSPIAPFLQTKNPKS